MHISLEINDDYIDGFTIGRMASAFHNGRFEVFLTHRIGSVKDRHGNALGRFTSGKGINEDLHEAFNLAEAKLITNVALALEEQNAREPGKAAPVSNEEAELFKLLDL